MKSGSQRLVWNSVPQVSIIQTWEMTLKNNKKNPAVLPGQHSSLSCLIPPVCWWHQNILLRILSWVSKDSVPIHLLPRISMTNNPKSWLPNETPQRWSLAQIIPEFAAALECTDLDLSLCLVASVSWFVFPHLFSKLSLACFPLSSYYTVTNSGEDSMSFHCTVFLKHLYSTLKLLETPLSKWSVSNS